MTRRKLAVADLLAAVAAGVYAWRAARTGTPVTPGYQPRLKFHGDVTGEMR